MDSHNSGYVHCLLITGALITTIAMTLGIAGTFTNQATATASKATDSVTVTQSLLATCITCPTAPATNSMCSTNGWVSQCVQNQPVSASYMIAVVGYNYVFWGSNQLTAGLAFSIMAWLVEFLALLLGLLCIVESSNSTLSSGRLLDWERMPVVLFITVVAICFRCVALGCLYNYELVTLLNSDSYFAGLVTATQAAAATSGYSYSSQTNAGPILAFIALGFSVIAMIVYSIAVNFAIKDFQAPPKPVAVVAAATAPAVAPAAAPAAAARAAAV